MLRPVFGVCSCILQCGHLLHMISVQGQIQTNTAARVVINWISVATCVPTVQSIAIQLFSYHSLIQTVYGYVYRCNVRSVAAATEPHAITCSQLAISSVMHNSYSVQLASPAAFMHIMLIHQLNCMPIDILHAYSNGAHW